eukprot:CAMPEP_0184687028 /NCGR_PEP_ID=MMETSP0312-20130426/24917_1 /TAXON_ID=31354 /ORGANISM="Compsopogon coeruleus, Strain SAG 36.94" /LENGTH=275 /DNA_ID=CAMNT_0027142729 /DNA_START=94 /DNA_END=921 /DNA_ORIENTATION=+
MVLTATVACELNWRREDFWRVRSHPSFLEHLVRCGMLRTAKAGEVRAVPADDNPSGTPHNARTMVYIPQDVQIPEVAVRIVGETLFELEDEQRWIEPLHPDDHHVLSFSVRANNLLRDLVRTEGKLRLEKIEDFERCRHVIDLQVSVDIFMVGGFIEASVKDNMEVFYRKYPDVVDAFRKLVIESVFPQDAICLETLPERKMELPITGTESPVSVSSAPDGMTFSEILEVFLSNYEQTRMERKAHGEENFDTQGSEELRRETCNDQNKSDPAISA